LSKQGVVRNKSHNKKEIDCSDSKPQSGFKDSFKGPLSINLEESSESQGISSVYSPAEIFQSSSGPGLGAPFKSRSFFSEGDSAESQLHSGYSQKISKQRFGLLQRFKPVLPEREAIYLFIEPQINGVAQEIPSYFNDFPQAIDFCGSKGALMLVFNNALAIVDNNSKSFFQQLDKILSGMAFLFFNTMLPTLSENTSSRAFTQFLRDFPEQRSLYDFKNRDNKTTLVFSLFCSQVPDFTNASFSAVSFDKESSSAEKPIDFCVDLEMDAVYRSPYHKAVFPLCIAFDIKIKNRCADVVWEKKHEFTAFPRDRRLNNKLTVGFGGPLLEAFEAMGYRYP
jgi:hypothetical protein